MSELAEIRHSLNLLSRRLKRLEYFTVREEEKQLAHNRSYCGHEPDLHKLQQNLTEIQKYLGSEGSEQEETMRALRALKCRYVDRGTEIAAIKENLNRIVNRHTI